MELRLVTSQFITVFDVSFAPGETGKQLLEKSTDHFTMGLKRLNLILRGEIGLKIKETDSD